VAYLDLYTSQSLSLAVMYTYILYFFLMPIENIGEEYTLYSKHILYFCFLGAIHWDQRLRFFMSDILLCWSCCISKSLVMLKSDSIGYALGFSVYTCAHLFRSLHSSYTELYYFIMIPEGCMLVIFYVCRLFFAREIIASFGCSWVISYCWI
jgi:hypothetical protein